MQIDFKYLYDLDLKDVHQFLEIYVEDFRGFSIKVEKETLGNPNVNPILFSFLDNDNLNNELKSKNVLSTIRELFLTNITNAYYKLTLTERVIIKTKFKLLLSKFEKYNLEFRYDDIHNKGKLEIEVLLRKEFFLTLFDLKTFISKINNSQENEPFENFLTDSGFYHIDMVKCLTEDSKAVLIDELNNLS